MVADRCPKSIITSASMAWLETLPIWLKQGAADAMNWEARCVDAMLTLEGQRSEEVSRNVRERI